MWKCKNCGEEGEENYDVCWNCGMGRDGSSPKLRKEMEPEKKKDKNGKTDFRYPNLLRLSILYRILAWVALGSALICSIWIAVGDYYFPWFLKIIFVLLIFFGGVISYITFQAFADGIHVFMDIEKNTREGRQKK